MCDANIVKSSYDCSDTESRISYLLSAFNRCSSFSGSGAADKIINTLIVYLDNYRRVCIFNAIFKLLTSLLYASVSNPISSCRLLLRIISPFLP